VNKMRFCGTFVPPTTGHLPIAFEAVILYDDYSLSNET
jgi:nicotinic acid mononucleotide adenylyltransferase